MKNVVHVHNQAHGPVSANERNGEGECFGEEPRGMLGSEGHRSVLKFLASECEPQVCVEGLLDEDVIVGILDVYGSGPIVGKDYPRHILGTVHVVMDDFLKLANEAVFKSLFQPILDKIRWGILRLHRQMAR